MIRQEEIAVVLDSQNENFWKQDPGFTREALSEIPVADSYATIITGIRRCGKSTVLLQLLRKEYKDALYLNFDDIRLSDFNTKDFIRLHREIEKREVKVLFFDEIQIIKEWEKYINQILREGYKVFITGSNASMLSKELGTHLTGRHLSMELFPFSYTEYIGFKNLKNTESSVEEYLQSGGIPEYVKSGVGAVLNGLVDDILMRDIAVRHSVRDVNSLRQLAAFLISNVGNSVAANKLVGMFDIKSASTFLEYFSFMKDAYLLEFVPRFSYSLKAQARNARKVYVMDMGLYTENTRSTSDNSGHRLENLVFLHLRRKYREIFYFKEKGECDFIVKDKNEVRMAIQVCYDVNDGNFDREYDGVMEAMEALKLNEGLIVTLNQNDIFEENGKTIKMISADKYLTQC